MTEWIAGLVTGAAFACIILGVVASALRDTPATVTKTIYVYVDPHDYREWTYRKAMDIFMALSSDGPDDDEPDDLPDDVQDEAVDGRSAQDPPNGSPEPLRKAA